MPLPDDNTEARAQGWRALATLHDRIASRIERALQAEHGLGVSEYAVLDVLSRQEGRHMRMQRLASAVVLSHSATTRLVTRLERLGLLRRYLCEDDRRGIYTQATEKGLELLAAAGPTHDGVLRAVLEEAHGLPELSPLADALQRQEPRARTTA
jgi:DNA-binding MarR family transcriptional regulator